MTLPIGEISDRLELQDLLVAYSHAVDAGRWDALDDVFTADAVIDYTELGGPKGDLAATKAFLADALGGFDCTQHLVGLPELHVEGDAAHGRTACHNPLVLDGQILVAGLWYRDAFTRTPAGWRIRERHAERGYLRAVATGS
jgi:hypothetical protein